MKLLVTGGAGFMGSNFIRYILTKYPDYTVINLDKLTYAGNLDNVRDLKKNPRYRFVKGDIADEKIVNDLVAQCDAVINYAAETHVDRSILGPKDFIMTDVIGTYTLLEAVREHKTQRFVQISTDEVYGSIQNGMFSETHPFNPSSPYAASKAGGDLLCGAYVKTYRTPIIVTHSCNFYGPYQYPEKLIPLFITNLLEGKKVPVYGDGMNVREWIYVPDHCSAIEFLLHHGKDGEVYNIGIGDENSNMEVTHFILQELGMGKEMIEYIKDRPGHDQRYAIDTQKLFSLGWKPQYSFEVGLRQTVKWYKENTWWWKKLKSGEYLKYYKRQYGTEVNQ